MKIVIADDDPMPRRLLEQTLVDWGHEVEAASDGLTAWSMLERVDTPCLAILDWVMPGLDGPTICHRVRAENPNEAMYLILLSANAEKEDVIAGLEAGANDYVTKPFHEGELYARIQNGLRMLEMQQKLTDRYAELSQAYAKVRQLQGLLPICAYCKSIRNDQNYWQRVEHYICAHADVKFSHGICPTCLKNVLRETTPEIAAL